MLRMQVELHLFKRINVSHYTFGVELFEKKTKALKIYRVIGGDRT